MTTGRDQVARLLALIPYLQSHPGARLDATAKLFGITEKQLRKDLDIAYMCGRPGLLPGDLIEVDMESVDGEGVIFLDNADDLARPLTLTPDEASSLVLALTAARDLADSSTTAAIESALAKLQSVLVSVPASGSVQVASAAPEVRDLLTRAIADGVAVQLTYDGPRRTSRPVVEPARIVVRDGIAYLQAWARARQDWRLYRLERIAALEPNAEPVTPREPPEVGANWAESLDDAGEVTLTVTPAAAWIAEYYPVRGADQLPDGTTRVRLAVSDPAWLSALLLRLGDGVVACDPPQCADGARRAAREALRHYGH